MPDVVVNLGSDPSTIGTSVLPLKWRDTIVFPQKSVACPRTTCHAFDPTVIATIRAPSALTRVMPVAFFRTQSAPIVLRIHQTDATIDVGDTIRLSAQWVVGGDHIDPTTVQLLIRLPNGSLITRSHVDGQPQIIRSDRGTYYSDYAPSMSGIYHYRWVGTSPGMAAEEGQFLVRPSQVLVGL